MKSNRIILSLLLIAVFALSAAVAQERNETLIEGAHAHGIRAAGDEADIAKIRPLIEEHNRRMVEAFKRGDYLGVARFYADDATILFSRGRKIQGREAIDKYWTGITGAKDWKLEVIELGGDRETVYQIGRSTLTSEREGRESVYACDFVVIWKRQPDGSYKIHVDIYN